MTSITIESASGGYSVRFRADDPGDFKLLVSTLKSFVRPTHREYWPESRRWEIDKVATDTLCRWCGYLKSMLHDIDVEWLVSDAPPPKPKAQRAGDPYTTLHLLPTAPPELVKSAYRCLATMHHPDKGGDADEMRRVNLAYETIARQIGGVG